jgi:hypothetical protein
LHAETNIKQLGFWEEYAGYILSYDGNKIRRIPPCGVKSDFHGDFRKKKCLQIANEQADIIITNPPFGEMWEKYVKCMVETGKTLIFWGNGTTASYNWFMPLLNDHKIHIIDAVSHKFLTDHYLTPTYHKKEVKGFIYTTENLSSVIKPGKPHFKKLNKMFVEKIAWRDDNGILCCDKAVIPEDSTEIIAVSVNIICHGIFGFILVLLVFRR